MSCRKQLYRMLIQGNISLTIVRFAFLAFHYDFLTLRVGVHDLKSTRIHLKITRSQHVHPFCTDGKFFSTRRDIRKREGLEIIDGQNSTLAYPRQKILKQAVLTSMRPSRLKRQRSKACPDQPGASPSEWLVGTHVKRTWRKP